MSRMQFIPPVDDLVSTEGWKDVFNGKNAAIALALAAIIAIIIGYKKYKAWKELGPADQNAVAEHIAKDLKREDVLRVVSRMKELPDEVMNTIFDIPATGNFRFSPNNLTAYLEFHKQLVKHFISVFHPIRMEMTKCPAEEAVTHTGKFKELLDKLTKNHFDTQFVTGKNTAMTGEYKLIPNTVKQYYINAATTPEGFTFKDIGWNRTMLPLLISHVLYFYYDFRTQYKPMLDQLDKTFINACTQLKGKVIEHYTSVAEQANEPLDLSNLENAENQSGTPGYCFGVSTGAFLLDPYGFFTKFKGYQSLPMLVHVCDKATKVLRSGSGESQPAAQTTSSL